jgi:YbbR domain-containing protein
MFRDILSRNFGWKLLSLALAIAIWVAVKTVSAERGNQSERTFLNVPAQIVSGTADVRTFRIEPNEVRVTVKGLPDSIRTLVAREIKVFVDVTGLETTQNLVKQVDVSLPNGVAVVNVEPANVQITIPPRGPMRSPANNP